MKSLCLIIIAAVMTIFSLSARQNRYTRPYPVAQDAPADTTAVDTIAAPQIALAGYDKPVDASRETIIATNNTGRDIIAVTLSIHYLDHAGNVIHSATVDIPTFMSPGETMMLSWPSWDKNRTYYYAHGRQPSVRRHAHPYTVRAEAVKAVAAGAN